MSRVLLKKKTGSLSRSAGTLVANASSVSTPLMLVKEVDPVRCDGGKLVAGPAFSPSSHGTSPTATAARCSFIHEFCRNQNCGGWTFAEGVRRVGRVHYWDERMKRDLADEKLSAPWQTPVKEIIKRTIVMDPALRSEVTLVKIKKSRVFIVPLKFN